FNFNFVTGGAASGGRQLVTADFNNDHITDIAVIDGVARATVLRGTGDYGFQVVTPVVPLQGFPPSLVAGDFNNDGKTDLIAGGSGVLQLALGIGDGTFQAPQTINVFSSTCPRLGVAMAVADFNLDGNLDIAVACSDSTATVFTGNGSGVFTILLSLSVGNLASAVGICALNA